MFGMSQKQILYIVVAVLVLGAALFIFLGSKQPEVSLKATLDKTEYLAGEQIELALSLNNTGEIATCVSDIAGGSISFTSITRDGGPVETRSVPADYLAPLPELLKVSLKPISPGEELLVVLSGENDPGLGARTLTTTALEDGTGIVTFYNVEKPGQYALELVYRYVGPDSSDCQSVFKGPSNAVNINFTVTE